MAAFSSLEAFSDTGYCRYPINFIIAYGNHAHEYGNGLGLPWESLYDSFPYLKNEKQYFKDKTTFTLDKTKKNAVIMGRRTYDGIGRKLPGRINIVLSSQYKKDLKTDEEDLYFLESFEAAIGYINSRLDIETIYIIGGMNVWSRIPKVYHQYFNRMYVTVINTKMFLKYHTKGGYHFDDFVNKKFIQFHFPFENKQYREKIQYVDNNLPYELPGFGWKVKEFLSKNAMMLVTDQMKAAKDEHNYLDLIKRIMNNGEYRYDRTGIGTIATFGNVLRYSLKNKKLPVITTKRTFIRAIKEELLWFISGKTDATLLSEKGIKIWDGNSSREYWDKLGRFDRKEGDIGAGYPFQWRHWGAKYIDKDTDYTGQGIDQLKNVIDKIKYNRHDRRLIVSAWNVSDLDDMALPPCHMMFQFFVSAEGLSCMMYQRSADMGLGVPFNITSYCLLTHMIAHICGHDANEFIHIMGDTHIYMNHLEPLAQQLLNNPTEFPTVEFSRPIDDIDDFKYEDINIIGYNPVPVTIKMDMAV